MSNWTELDRFEASLRATYLRTEKRRKHVLDSLDDEDRVYSLPDTIFGKLIGERDELANASVELKELLEQFIAVKNESTFTDNWDNN